jgi:transposase
MPEVIENTAPPEKRDLAALRSRRLQAAGLFSKGLSPSQVAHALEVTVQSAVRWKEKIELNGVESLSKVSKQGAHFRLSRRRFGELGGIIARPPPRFGNLRRNRPGWTPKVLQEFILRYFGVEYHLSHCWRLLRQLSKAADIPYPPPLPMPPPVVPASADATELDRPF